MTAKATAMARRLTPVRLLVRGARRRSVVLAVMIATLFALLVQPISPFVHFTFADWSTPTVYPIRDLQAHYPAPMVSPQNAHTSVRTPKVSPDHGFAASAHRPDAGSSVAPAAVSHLNAVAAGSTALVSWSAPASPGVTGYTVRALDAAGRTVQTQLVTGSSAWFFGLPAGRSSFAVLARAGARTGAPATSAPVLIGGAATGATAASAPLQVKAVWDGVNLSVSWKAPGDGGVAAAGYQVSVLGSDGSVLRTTWSMGTSTVVTSLGGGVAASVAVASVSNFGALSGAGTAAVVFASSAAGSGGSAADVAPAGRETPLVPTTANPTAPPNQPQSVTATAGNTTVSASWLAPKNGPTVSTYTATAFNPDGSVAGTPVTVCGTCLSATLTGLTNGLSYYVGVYASNANGNSPTTLSNTVTLPAPPSLSMSIAGGRTVFARGEQLTYSIVVANPQSFQMSVSSVTDALPATVVPPLVSLISEDGAPCSTSVCAVSGSTVTMSNFTVPANGSHTFNVPVVVVGSDRGCANDSNAVTASNPYGSNSASVTSTSCDGGAGNQAWWQMVARATGPQGTASFDLASGNLLVDQDDSTLMHLHGKLAFDVHRAYDSSASGNGASPASFGGVWTLSLDVVTGGVAAAALYVPATESPSQMAPVTVVDSEGTRDVVRLSPLSTPIDVTGLAGSSAPLSALVPHVLQLGGSSTRICADAVGSGSAGTHFGLWRYVELTSAGSGTPCTPAAGTTTSVLGFGLERADRVAYEFAWDGHKLGVADADGNRLQYQYTNPPAAGQPLGNLVAVVEPASGRSVTLSYPPAGGEVDITDAAQRLTRYTLDAGGRLVQVQNPDASTLSYGYGGCPGSAGQLCSATDARGHSTTFAYTTTWSDGTAVNGPPRISQVTDRAGAATQISYVLPNDYVNVDVMNGASVLERQQFSSIDSSGSVGEIDGIDVAANQTLHRELLFWDQDGSTCRQPDNAIDHDLCRTFRFTFNGAATAEDVTYVFNPLGSMLASHECQAATDPAVGATPAACPSVRRDTTLGWHSQYFEAGGSVVTFDDSIAGGGSVTSQGTTRADAQTVFAFDDKTQSLTPRGNALASGWAPYLTSYLVDDSSAAAPNGGVAGICTTPSAPVRNTGSVCEIDAPSFDNGVHPNAVTRMTYNADGSMATQTSAKSIAETTTGTPPAITYTYYADGDRDLSGNIPAGGWLKAQTDALGSSTVYAYDAAGNVARTWDRNAVGTTPISSFPGTVAAPTNNSYVEVLHGSGATAYSAPWRFTLSTRDQLGNLTTIIPDGNGNPLTTRPARGNPPGSPAVTTYDVTQTFDNADRVATRQTPAEAPGAATRYTYDALGRTTAVQDPRGDYTLYAYDIDNRVTLTKWTRGFYDSANVPGGCRQSSSADAPIPLGRTVCSSLRSYDGVDNVVSSTDGGGQVFTMAYDAFHHQTTKTSPRNNNGIGSVTESSRYDIDGNLLLSCPPMTIASGSSCRSGDQYSTERTYDVAGRLSTVTTHRGSGTSNTTTTSYDGDGNMVRSVDARGVPTTSVYDLDDHQTGMTVQRAAGTLMTTAYGWDRSGNKVSVTDAAGRITAYSYDADNRLVDTVLGAGSTSAAAAGVASADGGSNVRTRLVYDADGHVVAKYTPRAFTASVTSPNAEFMDSTVYDADGRAITRYTPRFDTASMTDLSLNGTQSSQCPTGAPGYPSNVGVCILRDYYDANGNKTKEIIPTAGGATSTYRQFTYQYTDDNMLASEVAPDPAQGGATVTTLSYYYDGDGHLVKTVDALGRPTTKTWTSDGLIASEAGEPGQNSHVTNYFYDANGNKVRVQDPAGLSTSYAYSSDNLLSSITDANNDVTSYQYDQVGNVTQQMTPSANAGDASNSLRLPVTMTYTDDNLLATQTKPISNGGSNPTYRKTIYGYDSSRNKASMDVQLSGGSSGDGGTQRFNYYNDNRLYTETGTDGTVITHQYDAAGNETSVSMPNSSIGANYYADNLIRSVSQNDSSPSGSATTNYGYDGGSNTISRNEIIGGTQYQTQYSYNDAGLVSSVSSNYPSGTWNWQYDAGGQVSLLTYPNGLHVNYTWQSDGTINVVNLANNAGSTLVQWAYLYDADYRKTEQDYHGVDAFGNPHQMYQNFSYDNAGRLSTFSYSVDGTFPPAMTATWDHDGNRLSWNGKTFTYNADDSLASGPNGNYSYSIPGNVTGDGCRGYGYDGFNHMTSAGAGCGSGASSTYYYDGLDRQRAANNGPYGETTLQRYDGMSQTTLLKQQQFSGSPDVYFTLDAKGNPLADMFATNGMQYSEYLADDGYGSVSTVTNAQGNISCDAYFNPFGESIFPQTHWGGSPYCNTGSANTDRLYNGNSRDPVTGTYQLGLRVYDPSKATFLQKDQWRKSDPLTELGAELQPGAENIWGYAHGDPVNYKDPFGLCAQNPDDPAAYKQCLQGSGGGGGGGGGAPTAGSSPASTATGNSSGSSGDSYVDDKPQHYSHASPPPDPEFVGVPTWTPATLHLLDDNAQRTMTVGDIKDGLGVTIDAAKLPIEATDEDYVKACINCSGTRTVDGKDFKWNGSMSTWVCGDKDAPGSNCGESSTFQYNWKDNKVEQYDDGIRTGWHALCDFVGDHAGAIVVGALIAVAVVALAPVALTAVTALAASDFGGASVAAAGVLGLTAGGSVAADDALTDISAGEVEGQAAADTAATDSAGGAGPVLQGQAGVDRSIAAAEARGETVLGREITMETSVARTRPDVLVRDAQGGLKFIESKNGPTAGLTANQRVAFPVLRTDGGIPRGANAAAAGLTPGVAIGPTPVQVDYWGEDQ